MRYFLKATLMLLLSISLLSCQKVEEEKNAIVESKISTSISGISSLTLKAGGDIIISGDGKMDGVFISTPSGTISKEGDALVISSKSENISAVIPGYIKKVSAESRSGNVDVREIKTDNLGIRLSGPGDLVLDQVDGSYITLSTESGDMEISNVDVDDLFFSSYSGNADVRSSSAKNLVVTSYSTKMDMELDGLESVKVETDSEEVSIKTDKKGARVSFAGGSESYADIFGLTINENGEYETGDGSIRLSFSTNSGGLRIK